MLPEDAGVPDTLLHLHKTPTDAGFAQGYKANGSESVRVTWRFLKAPLQRPQPAQIFSCRAFDEQKIPNLKRASQDVVRKKKKKEKMIRVRVPFPPRCGRLAGWLWAPAGPVPFTSAVRKMPVTSSWERGWEETSRGVERTISLTRLSETRTVSLAHVLQASPVPLPPSGPHPVTCHLALASAWSQGARSRRTTGQRHYVCGRLSPGLWPRSCSPDIRPSTTR